MAEALRTGYFQLTMDLDGVEMYDFQYNIPKDINNCEQARVFMINQIQDPQCLADLELLSAPPGTKEKILEHLDVIHWLKKFDISCLHLYGTDIMGFVHWAKQFDFSHQRLYSTGSTDFEEEGSSDETRTAHFMVEFYHQYHDFYVTVPRYIDSLLEAEQFLLQQLRSPDNLLDHINPKPLARPMLRQNLWTLDWKSRIGLRCIKLFDFDLRENPGGQKFSTALLSKMLDKELLLESHQDAYFRVYFHFQTIEKHTFHAKIPSTINSNKNAAFYILMEKCRTIDRLLDLCQFDHKKRSELEEMVQACPGDWRSCIKIECYLLESTYGGDGIVTESNPEEKKMKRTGQFNLIIKHPLHVERSLGLLRNVDSDIKTEDEALKFITKEIHTSQDVVNLLDEAPKSDQEDLLKLIDSFGPEWKDYVHIECLGLFDEDCLSRNSEESRSTYSRDIQDLERAVSLSIHVRTAFEAGDRRSFEEAMKILNEWRMELHLKLDRPIR